MLKDVPEKRTISQNDIHVIRRIYMTTLKSREETKKRLGFGMFLVAIGIVYGDIGTSPMYVMKSIIEGNGGLANVNEEFIIGSLSLTIWTITLLTTVKHVLIALRADNHGEGGIFSLYSLVRKCGKWLIIPTMIGGCTMLADGVLTPAVTVTTAVEGLRSIDFFNTLLGPGQVFVIIIAIVIISALFLIQKSGTSRIGKIFGPVMMIWFIFLGITGIWLAMGDLSVLRAFNPVYAVKVLLSPYNKSGFLILGSVFLCTTGAEALYTDMGHVGKENIYISWPFVKICLILNYIGQSAWIIQNFNNRELQGVPEINPFYMMLPEGLRPVAIILSALAAIIASQALISGSYTLVHEAASLDLMPHMQIHYPSDTKGQLYIPLVNNVLWICCILVVLYFRSGARMENAYGLAITISMLMMTVLFTVYIGVLHKKRIAAVLFAVVFGAIEAVFFISSLGKFTRGGYVALIISALLFYVMLCWYRGTMLENRQSVKLDIRRHVSGIKALKEDKEIPLFSNNLVYLLKPGEPYMIDRDVLYSILDKDAKRADAYWLVSVKTMEDPFVMEYSVDTFGTDFIFRVQLYLGYKVNQRVNIYLRQVVEDLIKSGEMPLQQKKHSIYGPSNVGGFKFLMIRKLIPQEGDISDADGLFIRSKYFIRRIIGSPVKWYGLETSNLKVEYVPLFLPTRKENNRLNRV